MNKRKVREAAGKAAAWLVDDLPEKDTVFSRQAVLTAGEIPELPKMLTQKQAQTRAFLELQFFDEWRRIVCIATGRYPKTVLGEGFRLLAPEEVSPDVTADAFRKANLAFLKASYIVKQVDDNALTSEQRAQKLDDQARMSWARQAMKAAEKASLSAMPITPSRNTSTAIPTITPPK
jgi:hypothetical protein